MPTVQIRLSLLRMWFERKLLDPSTGEQKDKLASRTQRGLEELIPSRDMILGGGLGLRAQPNRTYPPYSGLHQILQKALLLSASMVGSQMYGPLLNIMRPLSYRALRRYFGFSCQVCKNWPRLCRDCSASKRICAARNMQLQILGDPKP